MEEILTKLKTDFPYTVITHEGRTIKFNHRLTYKKLFHSIGNLSLIKLYTLEPSNDRTTITLH
jgi:hypothetical protein